MMDFYYLYNQRTYHVGYKCYKVKLHAISNHNSCLCKQGKQNSLKKILLNKANILIEY